MNEQLGPLGRLGSAPAGPPQDDQVGSPTLSDEVADRLTAYAHTPNAPAELRDMRRVVASGKATWAEMLSEPAQRPSQSAGSASLEELRQIWARLRAGESPEAITDEQVEQRTREERWTGPYTRVYQGRRPQRGDTGPA